MTEGSGGNKVAFGLDDDLTALQGVAIIACATPDGGSAIQMVQYGEPRVYQVIGLLRGALVDAERQFLEDMHE